MRYVDPGNPSSGKEEEPCPVCRDHYLQMSGDEDEGGNGDADHSIVRTICEHNFHKDCIIKAFDSSSRSDGVGKCPLCRRWLCYNRATHTS